MRFPGRRVDRGVWAVASASVLVAAVIVVSHRAAAPTALLGHQGASHAPDLSSGVSSAGAALNAHALWLERAAAQGMREAKAERRLTRTLADAQSELNAYAVNLEGMMQAGDGGGAVRRGLAQFPREAANLHALLDVSLGKADAEAVQMSEADQLPAAASQPLQRAFPPKGWTPESDPASVKDVARNLQKLRRVKSFGHAAAAARKGAAGRGGRGVAGKGTTQMLVQPSPLLGALPVRHGELYRDGTKWEETTVVPPESERDLEIDRVLKAEFNVTATDPIPGEGAAGNGTNGNGTNATEGEEEGEREMTPQDIIRACNSTCQHMILHSTIGLAFKVAAKCVPECATSKFMLDKKGAALPPWKTVEELKEQDTECQEYDGYLECKLDALDPVCDKLVATMPSYCPSHPKESICKECAQVEEYEDRQQHKQDVEDGKVSEGGVFGCMFGC